MIKQCRQCQNDFEVTHEDLTFYDKVSPVFGGKKYQIPPPTLCPDCRMQRRMSFRNERRLYERLCDKTQQAIVSMFSPSVPFPVYTSREWWSDHFDATSYGIIFDEHTSFLYQWASLQKKVPRGHIFTYADDRQINADYANCAGDLRNCYLIFGSQEDEDCYYSCNINKSRSCMDCFFGLENELNYECVDTEKCYHLFYCYNCFSSRDSAFLYDCHSCTNCIGCVGLRHKEYYIWNKPVDQKTFQKVWDDLFSGNKSTIDHWKTKFWLSIQSFPRKYMHGDHNENCTGNYVRNSKNSTYCFDTKNADDCKYCTWCINARDVQDFFAWGDVELCYEVVSSGEEQYHSAFTAASSGNKHCYYVDLCYYCSNCFGCIGLKHAEYCIFNKQYTKEEYETLVPKIIEKMMKESGEPQGGPFGEFFPPSLSPFGYNETVAMEYYPLTKEEALSKGFNWSDYEPPPPKVERILNQEQMKKLPDNIKDIPDDILNWALTCEVTGKPYRIIKQELQFYREHNLPIPRRHPDQRHKDRMALRNPRKLYDRTCMKCHKPIQTTYSPARPEIVYCEECYLKEVY